MKRILLSILCLSVLYISVSAQNPSTARRIRYGTPPSTCNPSTGDVYVDTSVTPPDFVRCVATNKWERESVGKVNAQTGTSYTFVKGDRAKLITFSNGSSIAVTLPQATSGGDFLSGWFVNVYNLGAGTVTVTPTTSTINGGATLSIATGEGALIFSNGTNYSALKTISSTSGAGTVTTTGSPASGNLAKFSGATSITNADLTGDVTTSGGVATTIANLAVTNAKIANSTIDLTAKVTGALPAANINSSVLDGSVSYCADAGANDTYACSLTPAPASYVTGAHYRFKANTANTGAASINFNSLGAKTIKKAAGGITTDLADNDILASQIVDLTYDGTNMQMQSTLGNAASGGGYAGVTTGGTGSLDLAQGTKTADEPFIDATVTWNSSGVTFNSIVVNPADTASASGSTLLLLKRSNNTIFSVGKTGTVSIPNSGSTITIAQNGTYGFSSGGTIGIGSGNSTGSINFSNSWSTTAPRDYTAASGSTNNPDFGANAYLYRVTPNAAGSTLTGGRDIGQTTEMHQIANVGSAMLTLSNNNSSSSAGRRWIAASNLDMRIAPNQMAPYIYDGTTGNLRIGKFETSETLNVTTQFDKTNTTLADVTELSIGVQASRTYQFSAVLFVDADASGGYKFAIGGTATATAIIYNINALNNGSSAYTLTSRQTSVGGSAGAATGTSLYVEISGTITVNAAGTLTVQFAQNSASGTSSVLVGSTFTVNNIR